LQQLGKRCIPLKQYDTCLIKMRIPVRSITRIENKIVRHELIPVKIIASVDGNRILGEIPGKEASPIELVVNWSGRLHPAQEIGGIDRKFHADAVIDATSGEPRVGTQQENHCYCCTRKRQKLPGSESRILIDGFHRNISEQQNGWNRRKPGVSHRTEGTKGGDD